MVWLGWIFSVAGFAQGLEELFPEARLTPAQVGATLTSEVLGDAARVYDQQAASAVVDRDRRILAMANGVPVSELVVSSGLRRYASLTLALRRVGVPDHAVGWFLAEHVGLAQNPSLRGTFMAGSEEGAAELVTQLVEGQADQALGVATVEVDGGLAGVVVALKGGLAFEAFPRVVEPGAAVRIPGTMLEAGGEYALFVQGVGTAVDVHPLEGEGAFDVEFLMPREPGVYRVAMSRYEKKRLPDQPFFFSMYVGVEPPVRLNLPDLGNAPKSIDDFEDQVIRAVNAARHRYGLAPLKVVAGPQGMRSLLERMPDEERATVRFLQRELERDPVPDRPHGAWAPLFGNGHLSAAATAWAWVEHPAWRDRVLDADYDQVIIGARKGDSGGYHAAAVLISPSADAGSVRESVRAQLAARWPGEDEPQAAPKVQAALDDVARRLASGKSRTAKFSKEVDRIFDDRELIQGTSGARMWVVPPGDEVDTSSMELEDWSKHLALGIANGDLGNGKGFTYTVILAIVSAKAE